MAITRDLGSSILDEGMIIGTEHELAYGRKSISWEWTGADVVTVDLSYVRLYFGIEPDEFVVGRRLNLGPFPVRVTSTDELWFGRVQVMRGNRAHTWLRAMVHRNSRWLDRVYRRLVMTGYVWGFATVCEGSIPHWRDVHILRRTAERLGK